MNKLGPALTALTIAILGTFVTSSAEATCFCMLRFRPPPRPGGAAATAIDRDPSYNPASAVFITRDGTRTVLTIEAAYQGPAVDLQMVIPVPTSIDRENVRTVTGTIFRRLDRRTAPEVVHVWPPCRRRPRMMARAASAEGMGGGGGPPQTEAARVLEEFGVDIEDEWAVDEYDISLLGAAQSTGLLAFLRERGLELPSTAEEALRAYIETDHRFVLARVDPTRAQLLGEQMMLSPIQLEYDSTELHVPVRLGTLNSPGEQELLLYILSPEGRFDVANRPSVVAPSDLRMQSRAARGSLAELYESITQEVFRRTPGAAITEFARPLGRRIGRFQVRDLGIPERTAGGPRWTLTRIRHRYGKDLDDDLVLEPAEPLRLTRRWRYPELRRGAAPRGESSFHVRFVVEHRGNGCISQATRRRYARRWAASESMWTANASLWPGLVLRDDIELLGITAGSTAPEGWPPPPPPPPAPPEPPAPMQPEASAAPETPTPIPPAAPPSEPESGFCAAAPHRRSDGTAWLFALGLAALLRRRRR